MNRVQVYTAGLGTADMELMLKSATITALLFALVSVVAVLYFSNRTKK